MENNNNMNQGGNKSNFNNNINNNNNMNAKNNANPAVSNNNKVAEDAGANKSVLYYSIAAIVIVALVVFMVVRRGKNGALVGNLDQKVDQTVTIPTEDTSKAVVHTKKPAVVVADEKNAISYEQALVKYKDARIQVNALCQVYPNNVTYKNGTSFMVDNRGSVPHTITVGSAYSVKDYGFKIITLSETVLPATVLVGCDNAQNVATILLQK